MRRRFARLCGWLLELIYPRRAVCMGCGSMLGCDRNDLCEDCRARLAKSWVGVRAPERGTGLDGAAYAYVYAGPAGGMVRRMKYGGVWILAEEMGADLARAVELLRIPSVCCVTAVPMHPKRLRRRGRNHAELLARQVAARLNLEYVELLMRTRNAPQQARLEAKARRENLRGGFVLRSEWWEKVSGADILLIDDVLTTGATAAGCAAALKEAGARCVWFAAYAHGERKKYGKDHER